MVAWKYNLPKQLGYARNHANARILESDQFACQATRSISESIQQLHGTRGAPTGYAAQKWRCQHSSCKPFILWLGFR